MRDIGSDDDESSSTDSLDLKFLDELDTAINKQDYMSDPSAEAVIVALRNGMREIARAASITLDPDKCDIDMDIVNQIRLGSIEDTLTCAIDQILNQIGAMCFNTRRQILHAVCDTAEACEVMGSSLSSAVTDAMNSIAISLQKKWSGEYEAVQGEAAGFYSEWMLQLVNNRLNKTEIRS